MKAFWKGKLTRSRIKKQLYGASNAFTPQMFGCKIINIQKDFKCFVVTNPMETRQVTYTRDILRSGWEIEIKRIRPEDYDLEV